jgi:hypothetical protein
MKTRYVKLVNCAGYHEVNIIQPAQRGNCSSSNLHGRAHTT